MILVLICHESRYCWEPVLKELLETWLYLFGSSMLVNWSFAYCWGGSQHCPCTCCLHKKETTTGFTAISHLQFGNVSTLKLLSQAEERPKLRSQTRVSMQNYFTCFCRYIAICSSQDLSSKGFGMKLLGFFSAVSHPATILASQAALPCFLISKVTFYCSLNCSNHCITVHFSSKLTVHLYKSTKPWMWWQHPSAHLQYGCTLYQGISRP